MQLHSVPSKEKSTKLKLLTSAYPASPYPWARTGQWLLIDPRSLWSDGEEGERSRFSTDALSTSGFHYYYAADVNLHRIAIVSKWQITASKCTWNYWKHVDNGRPLVAARTQLRVPTKIAKEIEEKATRIVIMHSRHDPLSLSFLFERSSHFSSPNRHLFPVPDRL